MVEGNAFYTFLYPTTNREMCVSTYMYLYSIYTVPTSTLYSRYLSVVVWHKLCESLSCLFFMFAKTQFEISVAQWFRRWSIEMAWVQIPPGVEIYANECEILPRINWAETTAAGIKGLKSPLQAVWIRPVISYNSYHLSCDWNPEFIKLSKGQKRLKTVILSNQHIMWKMLLQHYMHQ